jgi:plastocyanin
VKRIWAAAITAAITLAACGGAAAPAATTQPTVAAITAAPVTQAPATTQAPAATKAPVATQTPGASAPAAATGTRKVEVGATNDAYSIRTLEVKPGEKIEFVLTNTGDEKHNLVGIGEGISLVSPDFDSGSTVSWIWTAPTKLGTFKFQCSYHAAIPPIQVTVK